MNRKETTKFLSELLVRQRLTGRGKYYASEVSLDYGTNNVRRIDFLQFEPAGVIYQSDIEKGIFTCYEIKSCKEDVYSGNGLNFIGEKNYIVTTMECYKAIQPEDEYQNPTELTDDIAWELKVAYPCKQGRRKRSMTELLFCMLRSGK